MNLIKRYETGSGAKCDIFQMVKIEPEWAANTIQRYENIIKQLKTNSSGGYLDALLDAIQIAHDEIAPAPNVHYNRTGLLKGAAFSDGYLEGQRTGLQKAISIIKKSI